MCAWPGERPQSDRRYDRRLTGGDQPALSLQPNGFIATFRSSGLGPKFACVASDLIVVD